MGFSKGSESGAHTECSHLWLEVSSWVQMKQGGEASLARFPKAQGLQDGDNSWHLSKFLSAAHYFFCCLLWTSWVPLELTAEEPECSLPHAGVECVPHIVTIHPYSLLLWQSWAPVWTHRQTVSYLFNELRQITASKRSEINSALSCCPWRDGWHTVHLAHAVVLSWTGEVSLSLPFQSYFFFPLFCLPAWFPGLCFQLYCYFNETKEWLHWWIASSFARRLCDSALRQGGEFVKYLTSKLMWPPRTPTPNKLCSQSFPLWLSKACHTLLWLFWHVSEHLKERDWVLHVLSPQKLTN
jgi:hypothetical protein